MDKELATFRLGGTDEQAAKWIGISAEIYKQWPDKLHPIMSDRVYAAILRREAARALGQSARQFFADFRGEALLLSMLTRVSIAAIMSTLMPRLPPELAQPGAGANDLDEQPPPTISTIAPKKPLSMPVRTE